MVRGAKRGWIAGAAAISMSLQAIYIAEAHSIPDGDTGQTPGEQYPPAGATQPVSVAIPGVPAPLEGVVNQFKVWNAGRPVRVCFIGASQDLKEFFINTTRTWSTHGSLKFDFGSAATYRDCSGPEDRQSQLRVAFGYQHTGQDWDRGNWSYVGTDSLRAPAGPTLNIGYAADKRFDQLDQHEVRRLILHEFGHALALEHEHQSPVAHCEFAWEKVIPYFRNQYGWDESMVRANLGALTGQSGLKATPYDPQSIMHYSFPDWMFVKEHGAGNCAVPVNYEPSQTDLALYSQTYPEPTSQEEQLRQRGLQALEDLKSLVPDSKQRKLVGDVINSAAQSQFPNFMINIEQNEVCTGGSNISINTQGNNSPGIACVKGSVTQNNDNRTGNFGTDNRSGNFGSIDNRSGGTVNFGGTQVPPPAIPK